MKRTPPNMAQATAHYMALAAEMREREAINAVLEAGRKQADLIAEAKNILFKCVPPDGPSSWSTVCKLLGLLDGPQGREARDAWNAATASLNTRGNQ